jgi:membrane-bound inhibitor of C-type lysozyme
LPHEREPVMTGLCASIDCLRAGVRAGLRLLGAAVLAALLTSCASDMPRDVQLPEHVTYRCEGGRTFDVEFSPSGDLATLNLAGKSYRLPKVPGATQAKFSDGSTTLWLDGQNALMESRVALAGRNCRSEQELPERARSQRPLFGSDPWWR